MQNKRGQFYLIAAVIIIAMILGFVAISNQFKKKDFTKLYDVGEELRIEAAVVLDYGAYNNKDMKEFLINFTKTYLNYTEVENLYFLFGDTSEVSVAAYRKLTPITILVNGQEFNIPKEEYISQSYSNPTNPVVLTINEIEHEFELKQGENFYFIASYGSEEEDYVFTGSVIKPLNDKNE